MSQDKEKKREKGDNEEKEEIEHQNKMKRVTKKNRDEDYRSPDLMSLLGKVFTMSHSYRSPDVVQVIGWTKNSAKPDAKRRFIFVRSVNFISNNHMHGGDGKIDQNDILNISEPEYSGDEHLTLQTYTSLEGQEDFCLRRRDENYVTNLYPEHDLDHTYMWCDY